MELRDFLECIADLFNRKHWADFSQEEYNVLTELFESIDYDAYNRGMVDQKDLDERWLIQKCKRYKIIIKTIDIVPEVPKQIHINELYVKMFSYSHYYLKYRDKIPSTDDLIREYKTFYKSTLDNEITMFLEEVSAKTGCPKDLIGYSVYFLDKGERYAE